MKSCRLGLFLICTVAFVAVSLPDATAQSVCEGIGRVLDAARHDRPPFSSLRLYSLPGAVCDVDEEDSERAYFECFWEAQSQDLSLDEQDEEAKRFAGAINDCMVSGAFHDIKWRSWEEDGGDWKVSGKAKEARIAIWMIFSHKGMMDKYEGDHTDGIFLQIYGSQ